MEQNLGGRPALYDKASDMQIEAEKYFAECEEKTKRPTITGLCYSLGFESRQSFYDYESRDEFSYIIKRLRLKVESGYEEALSGNNCTGAIFALKNMGWKDKTEQEITGAMPVIWHEERTYQTKEQAQTNNGFIMTKGGPVPK
jgi:hypothetical protein